MNGFMKTARHWLTGLPIAEGLAKRLAHLDAAALIREGWALLSPRPGGKRLFSLLIGRLAPYSGTIGAEVEALEPGFARVRLEDRRAVRNHLGSVHAIALANLAELATGLAFNAALPAHARAILVSLSIEYRKKARGRLTATCRCPIPATNAREEYEIDGEIRDARGDVVALARARWLLGPKR